MKKFLLIIGICMVILAFSCSGITQKPDSQSEQSSIVATTDTQVQSYTDTLDNTLEDTQIESEEVSEDNSSEESIQAESASSATSSKSSSSKSSTTSISEYETTRIPI